MFSARVPWTLERNRLAAAVADRRRARAPMLDLTESNPTRVGLRYPPSLLEPLSQPEALQYDPQPLGLMVAREAVALELARRASVVEAERLVLTASTSEAYALLFKLLCDPGDEVLVPAPSYPLFGYLAGLDNVVAVPYRLEYHGAWRIDRSDLDERRSPRTRAVLTVHPNNPTGSLLQADELVWLAELCARHDFALIGDEVFADYRLEPAEGAVDSVLSASSLSESPLTFSLGGLSKSVGLPQLKLGWIAMGGPVDLVTAAAARLELICDTYLSVGTPVQLAAASLLAQGAAVRAQIQERVAGNHGMLREIAALHPGCCVLRAEGGWSAVVQVPATEPEEMMVLRLLDESAVLVHPGYFFDFPREAFLVVSLLPRPGEFRDAIGRVLESVAT